MNDAIRLLRAELILIQESLDRLQALKHTLQENTNGAEVTEASQAILPTLSKLDLLDKRKREFLQRIGIERMTAYAASRTDQQERDITLRLVEKAQMLQVQLRKELDQTKELLKRSKQFIDFHINVMTQTAANETYTPPGTAELENRRGIKMFDTNI